MALPLIVSKGQVFHLRPQGASYVIAVERDRWVSHRYWGSRIREYGGANAPRFVDRAFSPNPYPADRSFSLDTLAQEYPGYGRSDFRSPAFQARLADGSTAVDLFYKSFRITEGKPGLEGLPSTYRENPDEAATLELFLKDDVSGLEVVLSYTAFRDYCAIARSVRFRNEGKEPIRLTRALSMGLDMEGSDYKMLQLSGAWARERHPFWRPLVPGIQSVESRRGASGHQHNPFIAIATPDAGEYAGKVFGFSLVYSGNFLAQVEVDQYATTRIGMGINPFDFEWLLEPGESFQTPEVVMVYSAGGLGAMSRTFHGLYAKRLCRGKHRDAERPILIDNWEATYFNFDESKLKRIARDAKELGIECFVLDDGWFGHRDDDRTSLGDWKVDKRKLPHGLEGIVESARGGGLKFGLWFEPEMVSVDSDLYRAHPDWCLHVPGRSRSEGRGQLVLDLGRKEVRQYIIASLDSILGSLPIEYVKWDMNRNMTEVGSAALPPERQRETAHRYMLGLYEILEDITRRFPDILFESCSGGGGRFDPGMLFYMPQTWTSDNTDAVSRLKIQYATSIVYPPVTMGAHVSAAPNHQVHRITPLETRGHAAMSANLGYELDPAKLDDAEKREIRGQTAWYKKHRRLVQFGAFYRLLNPFEGPRAAWMSVSPDRKEAVVHYFQIAAEANAPQTVLCLRGLDPALEYRVDFADRAYGGDELMEAGLRLPELQGDYRSFRIHLLCRES